MLDLQSQFVPNSPSQFGRPITARDHKCIFCLLLLLLLLLRPVLTKCRQILVKILSSETSRPAPRPTQPPIQCLPGFFPERKADEASSYSPPSSADVRNEYLCSSYTPSWRGQGKLYLSSPHMGFTRIRPLGVAIIHVDRRTFRN